MILLWILLFLIYFEVQMINILMHIDIDINFDIDVHVVFYSY